MAHGVTPQPALHVHQVLHGYAQGHQQLAASVQLQPRDIKTMLVLSDISGPSTRPDDNGYLTGYPLLESKMYVLARTWAAPEMTRPGCVWTHSLLIDFADLAELSNPATLLTLFRRPETIDPASYSNRISVPILEPTIGLANEAIEFTKQILIGLYKKPHSRIIAVRPSTLNTDHVVIALWAQQWPRLKRAFRFCTLSGADRSFDTNVFDLQLLPSNDRSIRSRFQNVIDVGGVTAISEDWIEHTMRDLARANADGLRTFMRNIGGDVDSGRQAFRPLCRLHVLTQKFASHPESIGNAIQLLEEDLGAVQARSARNIVANAALNQAELDDGGLEFALRNIDFADMNALESGSSKLGREIWRRDPERLLKLLGGNERERTIAESSFQRLDLDALLEGAMRTPQLVAAALERRPELAASARFWSNTSVPINAVHDALAREPQYKPKVLMAMVDSHRADLIPRAVQEFGALFILKALATRWDDADSDHDDLRRWLHAAASESSTVAELLAGSTVLPWTMLEELARLLPPDDVPNNDGTDPWLIATRAMKGSGVTPSHLYLHAYIFTRALGWRSQNPGDLAQISFDPIYTAAAADRLPEDAWRMLEYRLPWSFYWLALDRCQRLRNAVSDLFVDRHLSPVLFSKISGDDGIFAAVVDTTSRSGRGRDFLESVRRNLERDGHRKNEKRIRIIEEVMG